MRPFTDRPQDRIVGILGGMGPLATAEFFANLVRLTPADKDWNHLHVVVENNPRLPSRSRAILYGEESPAPWLAEGARRLASLGAQVIAVPCNSASHYLAEARAAVTAEILDPVGATVAAIGGRVRRPLVLGGMVTFRARLYDGGFAGTGVEPAYPTDDEQVEVAALIEALKGGRVDDAVVARTRAVIDAGRARGADGVILGCTEFGLLADRLAGADVFDSNGLLARLTVARARGEA